MNGQPFFLKLEICWIERVVLWERYCDNFCIYLSLDGIFNSFYLECIEVLIYIFSQTFLIEKNSGGGFNSSENPTIFFSLRIIVNKLLYK